METTDKDIEAMEKLKQYIVLAYQEEDFRDLLKQYKSVQSSIDKMDRSEIESEFGIRFADLVEQHKSQMAQDQAAGISKDEGGDKDDINEAL